MLLQRGRFTIDSIDQIDTLEKDDKGLRKVIDLSYMGQAEYEGNIVPVSRMYIEMFKDDYRFYPVNQFDSSGRQMYYYFNSKLLEDKEEDFLEKRAEYDINGNYSMWEYMRYPNREYINNFWWNLSGDYFVFFGDEKKELINHFIESCYERDGKVEGIQKSLRKAGYKV